MSVLTPEAIRTPTVGHFPPDIKLMSTPNAKAAKGKQKEGETWQLGWCDLIPLMEGRRPPLQWTGSSTILFAHASLPRVVCMHFPSNHQFTLPSPPPCTSAPASYEPPTCIVSSSRDNWIFAYFPGVDEEGIGCLWRKGAQINNWVVKDFWTFPRGAGVVTARWLPSDREWVMSDTGTPARLPTLGPSLPLVHPVLILVTKSHLCNVYYVHPQTEQLKVLGANMLRKGEAKEQGQTSTDGRIDGPQGTGRCEHAAIGFGYDVSAIIIATRNSFVPSFNSNESPASNVDISMSGSLASHISEPETSSGWESWRCENTIELCEVTISVQGYLLNLSTNPLVPLRGFPNSTATLTDMVFVPLLPFYSLQNPSTPTQTHRIATPMSSPAISNSHVMQSPGRPPPRAPIKGTPPKPSADNTKGKIPVRGLNLLCTSVDLGNYSAKPRSEITLFGLRQTLARNDPMKQGWFHKRLSSNAHFSGIITHMLPFQHSTFGQPTSALISLVNAEGPIRRSPDSKADKQVEIGKFVVMKLPELAVDESWEASKMLVNLGTHGIDVPFSMAASPNHTLLASVSPSQLATMKTATVAIHPHPSKASFIHDGVLRSSKQLALVLGNSLQRRSAASDIVRFLTSPLVSIHTLVDGLMSLLHDIEINNNGSLSSHLFHVVGLAVDIYLSKEKLVESPSDKAELSSRASVGHDLCSLISCVRAWEEHADVDGYDIDALWYLVGLSGWTIEFLEKILKEAVLYNTESFLLDCKLSATQGASQDTQASNQDKALDDPFDPSEQLEAELKKSEAAETHFNLMHLLHPFALENVIFAARHVSRLRSFLTSISAKSEKAQMSKDALLDTVDSSGINLDLLIKTLNDARNDVKSLSDRLPDMSRRTLASLKPLSAHRPLLQSVTSKLAASVDKARLFIKPDDLVDSMLGLSMNTTVSNTDTKPKRDVITKGFLTGNPNSMVCLRCHRHTEISTQRPGPTSPRWLIWERSWAAHCVCGGLWMRQP